jgi:protoporphyrinogen oxidase
MSTIVVLGGGIGGLSTAFELKSSEQTTVCAPTY